METNKIEKAKEVLAELKDESNASIIEFALSIIDFMAENNC